MGTLILLAGVFLIGYGIGRSHGRAAEAKTFNKAANKVFGAFKKDE